MKRSFRYVCEYQSRYNTNHGKFAESLDNIIHRGDVGHAAIFLKAYPDAWISSVMIKSLLTNSKHKTISSDLVYILTMVEKIEGYLPNELIEIISSFRLENQSDSVIPYVCYVAKKANERCLWSAIDGFEEMAHESDCDEFEKYVKALVYDENDHYV